MDIKKRKIKWKKLDKLAQKIGKTINKTGWHPDYIVGLVRGGTVPAVILSHILNKPMWALKISLRDGRDTESNCWMPEDVVNGKNILIVDDINDSGATLSWIRDDWYSSVAGIVSRENWLDMWHKQVKIAVLFNNLSSAETVDFSGETIDKNRDPRWIVFPYESK